MVKVIVVALMLSLAACGGAPEMNAQQKSDYSSNFKRCMELGKEDASVCETYATKMAASQ